MKQVTKNTHFLQSFIHAKNGIMFAVKEERNMRKHLCLGFIICVVAFCFQCTFSEWLWISHAIFMMFLSELINTIVENVVDVMAENRYYEWAKKIKDMAAGVVLLTAAYAIIVALFIFIPKMF